MESEREWFVPDSVLKLTEAQFITRGMALHAASRFQKMGADGVSMTPMNNTEATKMLRDFYKSKIAE